MPIIQPNIVGLTRSEQEEARLRRLSSLADTILSARQLSLMERQQAYDEFTKEVERLGGKIALAIPEVREQLSSLARQVWGRDADKILEAYTKTVITPEDASILATSGLLTGNIIPEEAPQEPVPQQQPQTQQQQPTPGTPVSDQQTQSPSAATPVQPPPSPAQPATSDNWEAVVPFKKEDLQSLLSLHRNIGTEFAKFLNRQIDEGVLQGAKRITNPAAFDDPDRLLQLIQQNPRSWNTFLQTQVPPVVENVEMGRYVDQRSEELLAEWEEKFKEPGALKEVFIPESPWRKMTREVYQSLPLEERRRMARQAAINEYINMRKNGDQPSLQSTLDKYLVEIKTTQEVPAGPTTEAPPTPISEEEIKAQQEEVKQIAEQVKKEARAGRFKVNPETRNAAIWEAGARYLNYAIGAERIPDTPNGVVRMMLRSANDIAKEAQQIQNELTRAQTEEAYARAELFRRQAQSMILEAYAAAQEAATKSAGDYAKNITDYLKIEQDAVFKMMDELNQAKGNPDKIKEVTDKWMGYINGMRKYMEPVLKQAGVLPFTWVVDVIIQSTGLFGVVKKGIPQFYQSPYFEEGQSRSGGEGLSPRALEYYQKIQGNVR